MCGINVIIDRTSSADEANLGRMLSATAHRGPDHTGQSRFAIDGALLLLGANRLRIRDVAERSDQPFQDPKGRYALVFNGEIYNFYDLKNELLAKGYVFTTSSDTEVLLYWLMSRGSAGVRALNGMFSFVFADLVTGRVMAARDRWGMKPLYYAANGQHVILSSEIRGILRSGLVEKKLNRKQVEHYLRYKYAKPPQTFYENIFELGPGELFIYEKGKTEIGSYAGTPAAGAAEEPAGDRATLVTKVETLLRSALVTHLQSDVPVGLLLSGGVDSTLLLALAREEGYSMPSFSIVNQKEDVRFGTGDYKYARQAALQYRSEHTVLEVDDSVLKDFDFFIRQLDQPVADSGAWMTWLICKKAADSVKVLLSGAGADELFGGYNRHRAFYWYLKNRKTVERLLPLFRSVAVVPDGLNLPWRKQLRLIKKWAYSLDKTPATTWNRMISMPEFGAGTEPENWDKDEGIEPIMQRALEDDRRGYLVSDVLAVNDRMSMLNSVEMRMPYLDDPLSDFAENISPAELFRHGGKSILKQILNAYGGGKFSTRNKEGFGMPVGNWFKNKKHDYLWELFAGDGHLVFDFVKRSKITGMIERHRNGKADLSPELWSVLTLGYWLAMEFE